MKKLALAVTVLAFGALMVAGCPTDNTASNKKDSGGDNKEACGGDNKDACAE
jgi:hypothetical protein